MDSKFQDAAKAGWPARFVKDSAEPSNAFVLSSDLHNGRITSGAGKDDERAINVVGLRRANDR